MTLLQIFFTFQRKSFETGDEKQSQHKQNFRARSQFLIQHKAMWAWYIFLAVNKMQSALELHLLQYQQPRSHLKPSLLALNYTFCPKMSSGCYIFILAS